MKKSIILFFMTCSVACVPIVNDEIVYFHEGGNLNKTLIEVNNRNSKGSKVEIRGTCVSSCTTYLAVKNHCVSPTVVLGFHGPLIGDHQLLEPTSMASVTRMYILLRHIRLISRSASGKNFDMIVGCFPKSTG
ncbi:MAG: hypothetical protein EBY35_02335 [Rhodobacteraceae bacterium]|nr:hypothetical protein [Paracoccaceae bacterium]